jgi:serine/threonine protein kinase
MTTPHMPDSDREQHLNEILLAYVEALEAGQAPDRNQLLDGNPDFAAELSEFFASRDQLERLAAPLRPGRGWNGEGGGKKSTPATNAAPPALGQLGDFQLLREIGRGGMGVVYEAKQISLNRTVALKVLPFAAALDPKHLQRFKNEAQAAAQLHHTNIVPVYAVGCERGVHYYAMQLIEGQSLAAMIAELRQIASRTAAPAEGTHGDSAQAFQLLTGQFQSVVRAESPEEKTGPYIPSTAEPEDPPREPTTQAQVAVATERSIKSRRYFHRVARLGLRAAEALEHAHQVGVVHRDIKPANLLVDVQGTLWVTDFGLALYRGDAGLTLTGELLGTVRYMSPEQALAKRALVDHRTDIYSLGVTLYELLTLEPVFDGTDRQELLHQIAFEEPQPPRKLDRTIPVELETIVLKAIAKSPADRYATAQDFADDLQRFLEDKPILARRPTMLEKATKWSRRHRSVVFSAVAGLLVMAAGLGVSTVLIAGAYDRERQKAHEAEARRQEANNQRKLAELSLQDANNQRSRAEASFAQARQVVDFIFQFCQEELADKPGLKDLRRKCLEAALSYYKSFIDQRGDDPALQEALASSYSKVSNILVELGEMPQAVAVLDQGLQAMEKQVRRNPGDPRSNFNWNIIHHQLWALQGGFHFDLLRQTDVQEDLQLTDEQIRQITQFTQRLAEQRGELKQTRSREAWTKKLEEFGAANEKAIQAILAPDQVERLAQLSIQSRGLRAFREPKVTAALRFTAAQQERIQEILDGNHLVMHVIREYTMSDGNPQDVRRISDEVKRSAIDKIIQLLQEDQQAQWQRLAGRPFQGEFRGPGGGGPDSFAPKLR